MPDSKMGKTKQAEFDRIAEAEFDGHYTIMRFTTNWRVAFGTISLATHEELREHIDRMAVGSTLGEAINKAIAGRVCL